MSPFDFIKQIYVEKQDLMEDPEVEKEYNSFLANRALSSFVDCIFYAEEMNRYPFLDKKLQFHYLLYSIRPKKRYKPWLKREKNLDLEAVAEFYKINIRRAKEILQIIKPDDLVAIKAKVDKGGDES